MHGTLPSGHPDRFLFTFSTLTTSPAIYSHTPGHATLETLQPPQVSLCNTTVEDLCATSADGTPVVYHVVRPTDADPQAPLPTLLYGYGGFNYPFVPQFPGPMAAFVAAGGAFVQVHMRGGAEFGLNWSEDGRQKNKQNSFDDLYAVAEDLLETGRCTPDLMAFTGRSLGGMVAGVAITQRPDLWKVVVPRVPFLDPVGASQRSSYGRMAVLMELADVNQPDELRRLETISPYYLVRQGIDYPAVYIDAGGSDPRCEPWHARKFAARLQEASSGTAPVLLHVWENVGHAYATDVEVSVNEQAEWLAFVLRELGMPLESELAIADREAARVLTGSGTPTRNVVRARHPVP